MDESAPSARGVRRWFRFRLRTLLIVAPLITILLTWGGMRWYAGYVDAWAVGEIQKLKGLVVRDDHQRVTHVELPGRAVDDEALEKLMPALSSFPRLETLVLASNKVSDVGLEQLTKLPKLKLVYLADTKVTDAGIAKLQANNPGLKVDRITPNPRAMKLAVRAIYKHAIVALALAPDSTLISGAGDGQVRLWDLRKQEMAGQFAAHSEWAFAIARHPTQPWIATGGGDGLIKMWDWNTGEELERFVGHEDDVHGLAFTPDGRTLVSAGDDMLVRIWDVASRKERFALAGHTGTIPAVAISPDGTLAASASRDNTIRLWYIATGEHVGALTGHTKDVLSVDFHPSGTELASASYDGTIKLWNVNERRAIATSAKHGDWVFGVRYSPDGERLMSTAGDGARLWQRPGLVPHWHRDEQTVLSISLWLDSQRVALASADGSIVVRDLRGRQLAALWTRHRPSL